MDGFTSDLPLVVFWTKTTAPVDKSDDYTNFSMTTFEPAPGGDVIWPASATLSVRSGLRVRGSSSAGYPKKPYRVEAWNPLDDPPVDLDISLLGMAPEGDWIFVAPLNFDRALMRNALIYQLSNNIGRYAARTRFAELFVAEQGESIGMDDYVGIYLVVERIERDTSRIPLTQLLPTDLLEPELTGAYIFKEDRLGPDDLGFTAGTANGVFDFEQPFVFVDPSEQDARPEQRTYLANELNDLAEALTSPSFVSPATGRHYDQIIDVDSWIDHHILNVYTKNPDAFRLSGFFHKDRDQRIHAGPIWDFDRTMGCEDDTRALDPTWWDPTNETSDATYVFEHGFWPGLFSDPVFADKYWARWSDLLAIELSVQNVELVIDEMAAQLTATAPRNFDAWTDYPPRGGSLASEVDLLKNWLATRHAWMSACLNLPDPKFCPGQ
jgi:hypothetical protein